MANIHPYIYVGLKVILTPQAIIKKVELYTGLSLFAENQKKEFAEARQLAVYIMANKTDLEPEQITDSINYKRASYYYNLNAVSQKLKYDKKFRLKYKALLEYYSI